MTTVPTRIDDPWGERTPYPPGADWPVRVDEHYADGIDAHAQATRDRTLLGLAEDCHPQNLRQLRWANTMIKTLTPQALSSL